MTDIVERLRAYRMDVDSPDVVYEAADEIERLRGESKDWVPKIRELRAHDGSVELSLTDAHEVILGITNALRAMLDAHDATNYVECEIKAAGDEPRYLLRLQRYRHPTPHQLRQQAEARIDAALAIHAAHINHGSRVETACVCVACEMARALGVEDGERDG